MKILKYVIAFIFGVILTGFGLFVGLQIHPILGNIILFPLVITAYLLDTGFGLLPDIMRLGLFVLTICFWALASSRLWQSLFNRRQ